MRSQVMTAELLQLLGLPTPILQHLTRGFHEIVLDARPMEAGELDMSAHVMHGVSQFMEEGDHFVVLQQGRFVSSGGSEVGDHGGDGVLTGVGGEESEAGLQVPASSVRVLSVPRMQIQVKVTNEVCREGMIVRDVRVRV